jgi:hypothetical protein
VEPHSRPGGGGTFTGTGGFLGGGRLLPSVSWDTTFGKGPGWWAGMVDGEPEPEGGDEDAGQDTGEPASQPAVASG